MAVHDEHDVELRRSSPIGVLPTMHADSEEYDDATAYRPCWLQPSRPQARYIRDTCHMMQGSIKRKQVVRWRERLGPHLAYDGRGLAGTHCLHRVQDDLRLSRVSPSPFPSPLPSPTPSSPSSASVQRPANGRRGNIAKSHHDVDARLADRRLGVRDNQSPATRAAASARGIPRSHRLHPHADAPEFAEGSPSTPGLPSARGNKNKDDKTPTFRLCVCSTVLLHVCATLNRAS